MSETDSFISEVSEEVRRERLFAVLRRYGWIAVVVVLLLVAGAAWNEWRKAQARAAAEARGDAMLATFESGDPADRRAALAALDVEGPARAVVAMLTSDAALQAEDRAAAAEALTAVVRDGDMPDLYRDLARLKRVALLSGEMAPEARIDELQPLLVPGSAFRVLAEEQVALAEIEMGETESALERLRQIVDDTEASSGLRQRAQQLIVALGGEAAPA